MGVYNSEKTLNQAIDSIIQQTFKDWIFIICDDGSIDSSLDILTEYKNRYPNRFIILSNKHNRGLTYSLNKCLRFVKTEYVARMDADDISLPMRFEKQVAFLNKNKQYSFVSCAIERFDESGIWKKERVLNSSPSKSCFYMSSGFVHPTTMIRSNAIFEVGGYRDLWYTRRCEDYDLWMRMYSRGFYGYIIKDILFKYYEGKNSFPNRKYRYRIGEAITRARGYAILGMYPKGIIFVFKPLIAGILTPKMVKRLHKNR